MSGSAGRAGPEQDRAVTEAGGPTVRLSSVVHRRLLTIQYQRKMAGESVSLNEIIEQLLNRQVRHED